MRGGCETKPRLNSVARCTLPPDDHCSVSRESRPVKHPLFHLVSLAIVLIIATGCSTDSGSSEPTAIPEPTATVAPTLSPNAMTVGDLVARVEAAWPTVTSMRTTFWVATGTTGGTPPTTGAVSIETVIPPSSRHVVQMQDGAIVDEQISLDGRVYMKGSLVVAAIAPMVGTDTWILVDPTTATADSPVAMQVAYLLSPVTQPFDTITAETLATEAFPLGTVTLGERTCTTYGFGDQSGEGIRYELALDDANLPCQLLQIAGGYVNVTTYAFNLPDAVIVAPSIATPEPGA